jgi:hypothetical protein
LDGKGFVAVKGKYEMKCEDFETFGLDAGRDTTLGELQRVAAREHASTCPRCAALQDSWQVASGELRAFAEATQGTQISSRVELRLRQEFRTRHHTLKTRRAAVVTAWSLAAAAVIVAGVSWQNWRALQQHGFGNVVAGAQGNRGVVVDGNANTGGANAGDSSANDALVADNSENGFTPLPGTIPSDSEEAAIVRVRMQRSGLTALGLPVNEERAGDWIQVDLLVGNDGLPQAVRLPQE